MFRPGPEEAARLIGAGMRVPVYAELLADLETPTSAYWKLAHDAKQSFLLESVTGGEKLARYSFIGVNPPVMITSLGSVSGVTRTNTVELSAHDLEERETPLDFLRAQMGSRPYAQKI